MPTKPHKPARAGFFSSKGNMFTFSGAILAILISATAGVAFTGGYVISNWRNNAQIARLSSSNSVLAEANKKCDADISDAKSAMQQIITATQEKERKAAEAMEQARPKVEKRAVRIVQIKAKPIVPLNMQCEAIKEEQIEYVQDRRAE